MRRENQKNNSHRNDASGNFTGYIKSAKSYHLCGLISKLSKSAAKEDVTKICVSKMKR